MKPAQEKILRAAVQTLAGQGFARTTARAIAQTGGFAPGVIYYHFADLDDLFIAVTRYTSEARLGRYRSETTGITDPVALMPRLRRLYDDDQAEGHVAAIAELVAAAAGNPRLAEQVKVEVARWQSYAEEVIRGLLGESPVAELVPVPEVAAAAVATYLGLEVLSHLHAEEYGPDAMFAAGMRLVILYQAGVKGFS